MADAEDKLHTGSCYCGAVSYRAVGVAEIWYCHCTQCRALTGHYMAAAGVERAALDVTGEVKWVAVSARASHGFCGTCCAPLFWSRAGSPSISIVASSIDDPSGLECKGHIFVSEKGSYYDINDGLPQYERYPAEGTR